MNNPLFSHLPPLSLYIHIPWCVKKCPYCDFNSHALAGQLPEQPYVEALLEDLRQDLCLIQNRKLKSIFIGGGTPSLFSGSLVGKLLTEIDRLVPFSRDIEISLEANPGTAEQNRFDDYRAAGVNRLSLGVQSFNEHSLHLLKRIHSSAEASNAVAMARRAGFENINLDLMFALPEQSVAHALEDLQRAIELEPTHISWYQLTIEKNTAFYSRPPALPDDDQAWTIQQQGMMLLNSNNYRQYEISAYCRENFQCKHNLNYWRFGDYLGIGAGAHGKITSREGGHIVRTRKTRQPSHYLDSKRAYLANKRVISREDMALEFLMNALRLNDGVPKELFSKRTGIPLSEIKRPMELAEEKGLLSRTCGKISATEQGQRYLNNLLEVFIR